MAGKAIGGEAFTPNLAGMSKSQLYDIMSQMKILIEQNQQQARQILVENPLLTKALFQAQIMLGMVQPPKVMPNIQQALSQHPQQFTKPGLQLNIQSAYSSSVQIEQQDQAGASQTQIPLRKQHPNQPAMPIPPASVSPVTLHSQTMPSHSLQTVQQARGNLNAPATSMSLSRSSQILNIPSFSLHSSPQAPSLPQSPVPTVSSQSHQALQASGVPHLPLQPPLPQQPRLPSMPWLPHQLYLRMGPILGFQPSTGTQPHLSQHALHIGQSGFQPPASTGSSFLQGQPPIPIQPRPQSLYQVGGLHLGTHISNQARDSMQVERGATWMPGQPENVTGVQCPGPPSSVPGQMCPSSQPPRPPLLTPEMEKALFQQVIILTPEQINLLPPKQRQQVLQLRQMLQ